MTIDDWLAIACADADRRGLADLKPLLTTLAGATRALRAAGCEDANRALDVTHADRAPDPARDGGAE